MFLLLVTLISIVLAVIMSVIAWRAARDERRRSEARVAALAAEIHDPDPLPLHAARSDTPIETGARLFATAAPDRTGPRFATVVGIGVLVFGSLAAIAVVLGSHASADAVGDRQSAVESRAEMVPPAGPSGLNRTRPAPAEPRPLELVALGHDRNGDKLTVRGVVRNPETASEVDRVTAVVFVFNRDGGFVASGRAAIDRAALRPGADSTFIVTVPGARDVGRYRVSFRTEDRVVPHVDRRDHGQDKS